MLRLDPKDTTARLLSFPRDLWVPIAGTDTKRRINEAFQGNGPAAAQRLIETIKLNFGIPIDHYVQVNFASFKKLVDSIGGVPIYFDEPVRARSSGLNIPYAGCWTLDGTQALAFARARKDYQVFRDGEWQLDPSGDLGRINRQQYFLRVALKRAISKGIRNPATLRRLVDIGVAERRHRRAAAARRRDGPRPAVPQLQPREPEDLHRAGGRHGPRRRAGARAARRRSRADPHHLPGRAGPGDRRQHRGAPTDAGAGAGGERLADRRPGPSDDRRADPHRVHPGDARQRRHDARTRRSATRPGGPRRLVSWPGTWSAR